MTYPDFLFSPSVFLWTSLDVNPYERNSMHFWIAALISNMWIEVLLEVHAMIWSVGWNTRSQMMALPEPRRKV